MTNSKTSFRWLIVALCLLLNLVNYLDRAVIAYAIKPIQQDFHLNNAEFGLIISVFAIGTLVINLVSGNLADHISVKRLWSVAIFFWSLCMIFLGFTYVFSIFLIFRFLLGVGEGVNFPVLNRSLSHWLPDTEISKGLAIALVGVPFANVIGAPLLANLIHFIHWRGAFITLGIVGILVAILFVILYKDNPKDSKYVNDDEAEHIGRTPTQINTDKLLAIKTCLKNPTLMANNIAVFAFGYVLFFYIGWLPGFFEQTYHVKLVQIGWLMMIPWGLASITIFLGGYIADRIFQTTHNPRFAHVHLYWLSLLLSALCFMPLLVFHDEVLAIACLSLAIAFALFPNALFYALCQDVTYKFTGTATGIIITFFSASGILSPLLTGWLTDLTGNFHSAIIALIIFVLIAVLSLILFAKPEKYRID